MGGVGRDVRARTGLGDGVAESGDFAGFRVHGDRDFFLVERFEVARRPDLHGTVALEQGRGGAYREVFQEVFAGARIRAVPMGGWVGDVLKGTWVEAARLKEDVRRGARLTAGKPVFRRFAEVSHRDSQHGESDGE